ncbi:fatty acyl-CoA hydrolase precursor, medium chain-like isoform X2 [Mytilus edulis]|uniref:fatty acyl-CoA hydrolase precursor, medium chain-like isoform X2 n=1 Tax=Mytilus edulis TaxID=6550 RepID=UPI0039F0EC72
MDILEVIFSKFLYFYIFLISTKVLSLERTIDTNTETSVKDTKHGRIRGFISERLPGHKVEQFLGVPFAEPPVGNLRLERPIEPKPWTHILDTLKLPPACLQRTGNITNDTFSYIHRYVPGFNREDENCLYLNLYKPYEPKKSGKSKYPVLLFIHGGSNEVGMGAMFDGDILAGYSKMIVITFNYRLGALGFFGAKNENLEGNYGFLDQIMVMKWIRKNIHNFDGDASKVTIDGHSAGAADVGFHMISPLAKGLFKYAVIQSGSPLAFWATAGKDWKEGYNIDTFDLISRGNNKHKEYLKRLDQRTMKEIKAKHNPASFISFPAVVDKHFLVERPLQSFNRGQLNGESYLLSFTRDEGSEHAEALLHHYKVNTFEERIFHDVLKDLSPHQFPTICGISDIILHEYGQWEHDIKEEYKTVKRYIEMESDFVFVAPMIKLANMLSNFTNNLFLFSFDHVSELAQGPEWLGVPHGRDLFYLFGVPFVGHKHYNYSETDKVASRLMMTLWGNFVRYGKLTADGVRHLPHYRSNTRVFNRLFLTDNNITVKEFKNFKPRKMAFWNTFLPHLNCPEKKCQSNKGRSTVPHIVIVLMCCSLSTFYMTFLRWI